MTLKQWEESSPIRYHFHGVSVVVPDILKHELRIQLWQLEDYRVTSVTGGSIWLMPRHLIEHPDSRD